MQLRGTVFPLAVAFVIYTCRQGRTVCSRSVTMNIFTYVLIGFAVLAFMDKAAGLKLGLGESVDTGMGTMGPTTVAVLGASSVGMTFISAHAGGVESLAGILPFDPSMLMGASLCPEMGAFSLSSGMTDDPVLVVFNGVVLAGLLGQMISFQFPVFMATLDRSDHGIVIRGFIIGLMVIPVGLAVAAPMLGMSVKLFAAEFIPVLGICIMLGLGMLRFQDRTVRIVGGFARLIQIVIYLLLIIAVIGVFIPSLAYADGELVDDALMVILQCTVIICGALALSAVLIKIFRKQLNAVASRIGVNEVSVIAFVLNCMNSLAILPLYRKMDEKGKLMNAAFSVSGSYVFGGQMGFVASAVASSYYLVIFIAVKLLCGFTSMVIACKMYPKLAVKSDTTEKKEVQ